MPLFQSLISFAAPAFLITSPLTAYGDQILSMHRNRSSAGFSIDIPGIMLTASIIKVFYYPGARFDITLLIQSLVMLVVQSVLLKVALDNRPTQLRTEAFEVKLNGKSSGMHTPTWAPKRQSSRPLDFWRWTEQSSYWQYLGALFAGLAILHILLRPTPGHADGYTSLLGAVGLGIEAVIALPQLYSNYEQQSCKGFRVSVLASWLLGDLLKMSWFYTSAPGSIPFAFKACGIFQAACDIGLGVQYYVYGDRREYDNLDEHYA